MNKEQIKQAQIRLAKLMFVTELMISCIDDVEELAVYKHGVKQNCKQLKKLLTPDLDKGYFDLYQQDPDLVSGISFHLELLAKTIAELEIGQICAVNEAIPDFIKHEHEVKLLKLHA